MSNSNIPFDGDPEEWFRHPPVFLARDYENGGEERAVYFDHAGRMHVGSKEEAPETEDCCYGGTSVLEGMLQWCADAIWTGQSVESVLERAEAYSHWPNVEAEK